MPRKQSKHKGISALTPKQHEAIQALIRFGSYRAAASQMGIAPQTFKNHMSTTLHKLDFLSSVSAVIYYDRWLRDQPDHDRRVWQRRRDDRRLGNGRRSDDAL